MSGTEREWRRGVCVEGRVCGSGVDKEVGGDIHMSVILPFTNQSPLLYFASLPRCILL